jgi:streptogramin lyase
VADVAVDPWGNVFFAVIGASSPPSGNKIGMLDPTSNVIIEWPMPNTPNFAIETDPLGNAYFWELGPSPLRKIAKLHPGTNTLMEWDYSGNSPSEFISVDPSGKVFLAVSAVNAIVRLDPSVPEVVTVLNPNTRTVISTDSHVAPTSANYPPTTSSVTPTISCVTGMERGAFTEWTLPVPNSRPRGISADQIGNVFFTEQGPFNNAIGRLHLGLEVLIDIRPLSARNLVNPRSRGFIAVAVLSTPGFDAATVDPLTVRFGPGGATRRFRGFLVDVDRDGDRDLLLFFRIRETGIACGDTEAILTGATFEGVPIKGSDAIRTVRCRRW